MLVQCFRPRKKTEVLSDKKRVDIDTTRRENSSVIPPFSHLTHTPCSQSADSSLSPFFSRDFFMNITMPWRIFFLGKIHTSARIFFTQKVVYKGVSLMREEVKY